MSFEEELEKYGRFLFTSKGASMRPLIREGKDLVEISARTAPLRRFDTVLYKTGEGRYILHRIIRVREDGYDILGDNNLRVERNVKDEKIIGVLTAVVRNGTRRIEACSASYKLYAALWTGLYPLRAVLSRAITGLHILYRKMIPRR